MKALEIVIFTCLIIVAVSAADHEKRIPLDDVTIKASNYGVEAALSSKEDGSLGLRIVVGGKPVVIPEWALAGLKDVAVGSALFSTETPTGVPVTEWRLKGGLILSFQYGKRVLRPKDSNDYRAGCRIRISPDGNFERIETAIPDENSLNWNLLVRSKDGAVAHNEIVESVQCPMRWIECSR